RTTAPTARRRSPDRLCAPHSAFSVLPNRWALELDAAAAVDRDGAVALGDVLRALDRHAAGIENDLAAPRFQDDRRRLDDGRRRRLDLDRPLRRFADHRRR